MKLNPEDAPIRIRPLLDIYPLQNPLLDVERNDEGNVVLIYRKSLRRFERWMLRKLDGPEKIRRPLDKIGTSIWELCDGTRNVLSIAQLVDDQFKEEIAPAMPRVARFIQMLHQRNLVILLKKPVDEEKRAEICAQIAEMNKEPVYRGKKKDKSIDTPKKADGKRAGSKKKDGNI
ncbi:MAG: PqqD family protein [Candidatus Thermoplasmatota archaeon]|nr:PqqD family protein [Candidatus Thermoplasmatota archaeon]